jgi:hypothetical protein
LHVYEQTRKSHPESARHSAHIPTSLCSALLFFDPRFQKKKKQKPKANQYCCFTRSILEKEAVLQQRNFQIQYSTFQRQFVCESFFTAFSSGANIKNSE